ncbi:hypothetical protein SAY86_000694 [Trapa natans]|uniref:Uncharacterized protein n=1 Tax=Trapa natans TaxID=22666 RepID=A0AAN7MZ26_TRANT|nr:hypothetical protein SAY86_000694 [Trapa natans]
MAAAEARVVWQRVANRCFMQEDAKRAPKLACCQSTNSGSKQVDGGHAIPEDGRDIPVSGSTPFNREPSFYNLPSNTRWWLQLQPTYVFLKGLSSEEVNASETEIQILKSGTGKCRSKFEEETSVTIDGDGTKVDEALHGFSADHFSSSVNKCVDKTQQYTRILGSDGSKGLKTDDIMSSYEFVEIESFDSSFSKQSNKLGSEVYSPLMGRGKSEPWWRTTDKGDIATLVAKKSLDHVENCDLPTPKKMHFTRHPYSHLGCLDIRNVLEPTIGWKSQPHVIVNTTSQKMGSSDFGQNFGMEWGSADKGHFSYGSDKSSSKAGYSTAEDDMKMASGECSDSDPSKAQLLEALCHSQTRAREAERAAKRANDEKEHIIKLVFKQASQLFAYKQWFQLLQLESIYFQIKNNDGNPSVSTFFPKFHPRMISKGKKPSRSWLVDTKSKRGKIRESRIDVPKYAVAIALGLSLIGAGLLLGWTVGWMLPSL